MTGNITLDEILTRLSGSRQERLEKTLEAVNHKTKEELVYMISLMDETALKVLIANSFKYTFEKGESE